jgi:hypothetical protein
MIRTQLRNERKSGRDIANQITKRQAKRLAVVPRRIKYFYLPDRYGPQPVVHPRGTYHRRARRSRRNQNGASNPPMMPNMMGWPMIMQPPGMMPPPMGMGMPGPFMPVMGMGPRPAMLPPPIGMGIPPRPPMGITPFMPPMGMPPFMPQHGIPPMPPAINQPSLSIQAQNQPPIAFSNQPSQVPPGFSLGGIVNPSMVKTSQVPIEDLKPASVLTEE